MANKAESCDSLPLESIAAERESRIAFLRKPDDSVRRRFDQSVRGIGDNAVRLQAEAAWSFAENLDYHHPGQEKAVYLAHPMRVATLYVQLARPADGPGLATAILHNVFEVTSIGRDNLARVADQSVADAVGLLTVDRKRQWEHKYKDAYYRRLDDAPAFVRRVKILDKLDNLFLLCLNPSDEIRRRYLDEIEEWVLPMTGRTLPPLRPYLRELAADSRRIGHRPLKSGRT